MIFLDTNFENHYFKKIKNKKSKKLKGIKEKW